MRFVCLTLGLLCLAAGANAQNSYQSNKVIDALNEQNVRSGRVASPSLTAFKLSDHSDLQLDGLVNESVWNEIPTATQFTQRSPNDGATATQRTEGRILYTNSHIYVGIKAFDSARDSIVAPLFRRDGTEMSDWVTVGFDSYNDKRTAFIFAVNPRGVQRDFMIINDTNEDDTGMPFGKQKLN
ncbi:carbohydrate binding family 9 domain-containing protein [Gracilimonas amylolytica]|uniref:carbohydrate binding family 9 domain-containing protein n=1 Tax=Gracilimonas amylolytica TaxID=1749045 RepID=UPI001E2BE0A4|nr:carbohydrate binding family 9 domain-containing protein [Gracilimonas amylolytica]